MAQEVTVNVVVKGTKKAKKEIDKLDDSAKKTAGGFKGLSKDIGTAWGDVEIFGTSLNGVKEGFVASGKTAKAMFKTIKIGLISTGIGVFLIAIGSLVAWFKKSKEGAEKLETIFTKIGVTLSVIGERFVTLGSSLKNLFSGNFKQAGQDLKNTFKGVGDEIKREIDLTLNLKQATKELGKSTKDLTIETVKRKTELNALNRIARDTNKTEQERIEAQEKAGQIEADLFGKRQANATEELRILKERMSMKGDDMKQSKADLDKQAELELKLITLEAEGIELSVVNAEKIKAIRDQELADRTAIADEVLAEIEAKKKLAEQEVVKAKEKADRLAELKAQEKANLLEIELQAGKTQEELELYLAEQKYIQLKAQAEEFGVSINNITSQYEKEKLEIKKKFAKAEVEAEDKKNEIIRDSAMNLFGAITSGQEKGSKTWKKMATAQALMNTYLGVTTALKDPELPAIARWLNVATVLVTGMQNVQAIKNTTLDGSGGGSDTVSGPTGIGGEGILGDAMIPNQLTEQLSDVTEQPVQAYVVETDISNSQALQEELNLQTTL